MMTAYIYLIIFGVLLIASIILALIITKSLNSDESIDLIGGKLENSDASISDAMTYLKLTNEWNR